MGSITIGAAEKDNANYKGCTEESERWVEEMAEGHEENMKIREDIRQSEEDERMKQGKKK
jgi:hypothetical protein